MQDMNFFVAFNGKKKKSDSSTIILAIFVTIVVGFIVISCAYNSIGIYANNKEADDYKAKIEAPAMQKKIKESEQVNNKIDSLTKYEKGVTEVTNAIKTRDIVNILFLNKVSGTLPTEVTLKYVNITNESIVMQGDSTNRQAIAELEHNLKQMKQTDSNNYFYNVVVENISGTDKFSFQITCKLKGGENNENK